MNTQIRNTSRRLSLRFERPSWEVVLLIILLVTVVGVALRPPLKSFPTLASRNAFRADPYDLRAERTMNDVRERVELGL